MTVPSKGSLRFAEVGRSVSSISTPLLSGERGARLTRTRGGTDTTVVYTDRELSRKLLDHYGDGKVDANDDVVLDAKQIKIGMGAPNTAVRSGSSTDGTSTNLITDSNWKVTSHGLPTTIPDSATELDRSKTNTKAFFSGNLHGVPGQFRCEDTGNGACMITLTGSYTDDAADDNTNPDKLDEVMMKRHHCRRTCISSPAAPWLLFRWALRAFRASWGMI